IATAPPTSAPNTLAHDENESQPVGGASSVGQNQATASSGPRQQVSFATAVTGSAPPQQPLHSVPLPGWLDLSTSNAGDGRNKANDTFIAVLRALVMRLIEADDVSRQLTEVQIPSSFISVSTERSEGTPPLTVPVHTRSLAQRYRGTPSERPAVPRRQLSLGS